MYLKGVQNVERVDYIIEELHARMRSICQMQNDNAN